MTYKYKPPAVTNIRETRRNIADEFDRWNSQADARVVTDWDLPFLKDGTKHAEVRFNLRGNTVTMRIDAWDDFSTNLRCAYLNIKDMRLTEARGGAVGMRDAYLQLAAPAKVRDPYEVLGVRSDSPVEVIEGAYKALAKKHHPDAGGDAEAFKAVQAAWEAVKK
jgi:DnaJ-domain-containing protein 1